MIKRWENSFSLRNLGNTLFQRKINVHKNWLKNHSFWEPCGIGMKIKSILKCWFWIPLHKGTFSLLCSKIQGYMLSLMNEINPCITSAVGFVWDAKPIFPTMVSKQTSISCLYNMWLSFRIKENRFLGISKFCSNFSA